MTANDRDLRDRFVALRREEEAQARGFAAQRVSRREPVRRRSAATLLSAAACLLAIAGGGLWMRTALRRHQPKREEPVASLMEWKPPTDFLLETPGRELLRTVPAIGAVQNSLIAPTHHRGNPQVRKPALPKTRFALKEERS